MPAPEQVPALLLMADALKAAEPSGPGDPGAGGRRRARARTTSASRQKLDETRRAAGVLVQPRHHRSRSRTAARLHRLHRRPRAPRRFPRRGLGAARAASAGRRGHARGRPDLRLRPALRRHHADHAARRHAGRGRPQPGQGHQPQHRDGQPPAAHRLRHPHVPAAARPDAGDRPEHGQSLRGQADPVAADRAQRRRLRARLPAGPAGGHLGRRQHRRADRPRRLAGQRRHPELGAQPHRAHRAADAGCAGLRRPRPLRADRARRRRHAERADRPCR